MSLHVWVNPQNVQHPYKQRTLGDYDVSCRSINCNKCVMVGDPDNGESSACMGGEGNGNTLQYPSLGNPMDTGAWWATVHGVTKSQT